MRKYWIFGTIGVLFAIFIINKGPSSLNAPLFKNVSGVHNSSLQLTGTAYPNAKILVYINDQYTNDISVDENGSFSKTVSFKSEGTKKIKAKQSYKDITSEFSNELLVEIDITPPNDKLFNLTNEFPKNSKEKNILISGSGSPNDFVVLNDKEYKIQDNGNFEIKLELQKGHNDFKFSMVDQVGNNTKTLSMYTILVDDTPPTISNFLAPINRSATEESVIINIGTWQGYLDSINSVAITGSIKGDIKSLTLDGNTISWDENNDIYQRVNLFIYGGLNKYKVVAEDMAGNVSTGYVQTTSERTNEELDVNLND